MTLAVPTSNTPVSSGVWGTAITNLYNDLTEGDFVTGGDFDVTGNLLLGGVDIDGPFGAWTAYVPAWVGSVTNPVVGNGTLSGSFARGGRLGLFNVTVVFGSTTTVGSGNYTFGLPSGWTHATFTGGSRAIASAVIRDQSGAVHTIAGGILASATGTSIDLRYNGGNLVTNALPYAWATGDFIAITGLLELAA